MRTVAEAKKKGQTNSPRIAAAIWTGRAQGRWAQRPNASDPPRQARRSAKTIVTARGASSRRTAARGRTTPSASSAVSSHRPARTLTVSARSSTGPPRAGREGGRERATEGRGGLGRGATGGGAARGGGGAGPPETGGDGRVIGGGEGGGDGGATAGAATEAG